MRDQRADKFCPAGDAKVNRGIGAKSQIPLRYLEKAAVGEFSLSEEGSKPTPPLTSSHSKVFLELRHGVRTRPPFLTYLCWPRAQLWH